jgi:beta-glucosidase
MNVGDKNYDPLFPYGWGLRTDSGRQRLQVLRDQLESQPGSRNAVLALDATIAQRNWSGDGSVRNPSQMLALLAVVAGTMSGAKYNFAQQDVPVSVARDLAQSAIVAGGAAAMSATAVLTSNAEHSVVSGQPKQAVAGFGKARIIAVMLSH